jgi:hypothetical protein
LALESEAAQFVYDRDILQVAGLHDLARDAIAEYIVCERAVQDLVKYLNSLYDQVMNFLPNLGIEIDIAAERDYVIEQAIALAAPRRSSNGCEGG